IGSHKQRDRGLWPQAFRKVELVSGFGIESCVPHVANDADDHRWLAIPCHPHPFANGILPRPKALRQCATDDYGWEASHRAHFIVLVIIAAGPARDFHDRDVSGSDDSDWR